LNVPSRKQKEIQMTTLTFQDHAVEPSKALNITLWVVQVLAAAMFLMAGGNKLAGNPQMVGMFQAIGIGQWFRFLTGSLEVLGGVLLLIPALSGLGGLLLTGVMVGAVATHLFIIGGNPTMAIVLLAASAFIAWNRRGRTLALIDR
jgi:putative oxidoreductase